MKKQKPTTPGRRHAIKEDFSILTKKEPAGLRAAELQSGIKEGE